MNQYTVICILQYFTREYIVESHYYFNYEVEGEAITQYLNRVVSMFCIPKNVRVSFATVKSRA